MKTHTAPADPLAQVHSTASALFCASGWPALQCIRLSSVLGPRQVLGVLAEEQRRVEWSGNWGDWHRVSTRLRALEASRRGASQIAGRNRPNQHQSPHRAG